MAMADGVSIMLTGYGERRCTAHQMDVAMRRHLPASPNDLRKKIDSHENNDFEPGHFDGLTTVTECLMVLAELDGQSEG